MAKSRIRSTGHALGKRLKRRNGLWADERIAELQELERMTPPEGSEKEQEWLQACLSLEDEITTTAF
ncbi:hypothetical protein LPJ61_005538, partial [Coemansia biformis]